MAAKRDKFSEAYFEYYSLVRSVVYARVRDLDDSEDITQEVFIRFYEKMDEVENPRRWLLGAVRNVVFEYYRRRHGDEVNVESLFNDVSLSFVNGLRETRLIIDDALSHMEGVLDVQDQVLFQLVAVHGYSYSEAAKHLGFTKRKVEYRYRRITASLLDYLKSVRGIMSFEELL
jgi:RNA polymerase sigma factor (sigma-70 family)